MIFPGKIIWIAADWGRALLYGLLLADWGLPRKVVSDRDTKFTSEMWQSLFSGLGVKLAMVTAYNPKGNGLIERANQTIELALRYHISTSEVPWPDIIPALQFQLNNRKNQSGSSPNELVLGFKPTVVTDMLRPDRQMSEDTRKTARRMYAEEAAQASDYAAMSSK